MSPKPVRVITAARMKMASFPLSFMSFLLSEEWSVFFIFLSFNSLDEAEGEKVPV